MPERHERQPEPTFPDRLAEDLRSLLRVDLPVPGEIEDELVSLAGGRLSRRGRLRLHARRAGPLAAAAGLAITAWIGLWWMRGVGTGPALSPPGQASAASIFDIDASGRVDVLDAFIVARALHQGGMTDRKWDVTGDGAVNRLDVDAIAAVAVSIVRGTSS
ncbi:MAG: hypothetical protein IH985_09025 [Planctomycetes bacterium]|nr:hypothetical protein [Planctomycetota bacterium]